MLGNIEIGAYARIAAGSVVRHPVEPHTTVAGVPAKVIRKNDAQDGTCSVNQAIDELSYDAFSYMI